MEQEHGNIYDQHAITVMKDGLVVGRVPRELSKLFWTFLASGGRITSEVKGRRKKGRGLEVPCTYKIHGSKELVDKLKYSMEKL